MCSPPFQAQISMTFEHETLSLYKQSRLWLRRSVNAVIPYNSLNLTVPKGIPMALKIVYKICCGIDVHKTFVVACITSTDNKDITSYMVRTNYTYYVLNFDYPWIPLLSFMWFARPTFIVQRRFSI